VEVRGDIEIALAAAFGDGSGILINAGTGSIAYARGPMANCIAPVATAGSSATKAAATGWATRARGGRARARRPRGIVHLAGAAAGRVGFTDVR